MCCCNMVWSGVPICIGDQEAVRICEEYVAKYLSKGYKLPKRADNLFESGHCPELDESLVLRPDKASYYQSLIEVMRWIIEIG